MHSYLSNVMPAEMYADWRRHTGTAIFIISGVVLISGAIWPKPIFHWVFLACGVVAGIIMISAQRRSAAIARNHRGGEILAFVFDPHPINSLLRTLSQYEDLRSIAVIKLMSADLPQSDEYYKKGDGSAEPLMEILKNKCPDADVTVYGPCRSRSVAPESNRIHYVQTKGTLTKHENLIITKQNKAYVWHEPYHDIKGTKHIFTGGAYLIEVKDDALRIQVEQKFKDLPR